MENNTVHTIISRSYSTAFSVESCWGKISNQSKELSKGAIDYKEYADILVRVVYDHAYWITIMICSPEDISDLGNNIVITATSLKELNKEQKENVIKKVYQIGNLILP